MSSCAIAALMDDQNLVRRWCGGEEEAFSQLYSRYQGRVFSTAYRIMGDSEDARDATQEIFLKVYRALPSWDPDKSSLSTWLFRLAANHAIDCWRRKRRRQNMEIAVEPMEPWGSSGSGSTSLRNPHRLLEAKEAAFMVARYVERLPDLQKRFVTLRYFRELSLGEIAAREGRSIGTVKGLLHRATRSVRRRMNPHRPS